MACDFEQEQIADAKALLKQVTAAIRALADPTVSAYTIDTGQSVQRVTRENLPGLYAQRTDLQNEIIMFENRCSGRGVTHVVPAW